MCRQFYCDPVPAPTQYKQYSLHCDGELIWLFGICQYLEPVTDITTLTGYHNAVSTMHVAAHYAINPEGIITQCLPCMWPLIMPLILSVLICKLHQMFWKLVLFFHIG